MTVDGESGSVLGEACHDTKAMCDSSRDMVHSECLN